MEKRKYVIILISLITKALGVIIGTTLGAFVFKRIPNRIFRYVVYAYIAVSGVIILLSSCHS